MVKLQQVSHCKKIHFLSDGFLIKGTLHLPSVECPPVVIGAHGLLSSSDSPKQRELAIRCNEFGLAFFRFDHRGCGASQGYFPEVTSLETRVNDLLSAVRTIRSRKDTGHNLGLFGSSMGGTICLAVARKVGADALVTYAAPIRSKTINRLPEGAGNAAAVLSATGSTNLQFNISDKLKGVRNILIFHGDGDEIVPFSSAEEIFNNAGKPKRLIRQKQGDHPMSRQSHQTEFIREAARWFVSGLSP